MTDNNKKIKKRERDEKNSQYSRSSSSKHLVPLRLRAHAQRRSEKQRKHHDETDLQRTLSSNKVQNSRRSHQQRHSGKDKDEADHNINTAFAVEM